MAIRLIINYLQSRLTLTMWDLAPVLKKIGQKYVKCLCQKHEVQRYWPLVRPTFVKMRTANHEILTEMLLLERSKPHILKIANWAAVEQARMDALVELFLENDPKLSMRISWSLWYAGEKSPDMLGKWLVKMVGELRKSPSESVKRNIVRLFEDIEITEEILDELADCCFQFVTNPKEAIAVRAFSMTVLGKICQKVPELKPELRLILEDIPPDAAPALRVRARDVMKKL